MDKIFSARTCPCRELAEITTLTESSNQKRVYICRNPICRESSRCNTIDEKTLGELQYPLK